MMYPLLNQMLVLRIIGVEHLDRFPAPASLGRIISLNRKARKQRRQRRALRIHTRLDQFLRATQVPIAVDHVPRASHRSDPEAKEQRVPVFLGPFFCALQASLVGFEKGFAFAFTLDGALLLRGVFDVVGG